MNTDDIKFDEKGLVPVVVQDAQNGQVLMFAYANKEALEKTVETKRAHFWSRSRNKLWEKGEESGNYQEVDEILLDCDRDAVLFLVNQKGVACHTGSRSCFFTNADLEQQNAPYFNNLGEGKSLEDVFQVIEDRKGNRRDASYVSSLFNKGVDVILAKVVEEAGETIVAAKNESREEIIYEVADLWFHTLVALSYFDITPEEIYRELGRRFGKSKESYGQKRPD